MGLPGTMGLVGDLTTGEILEQLVYALGVAPVRNVVFMVKTSSVVSLPTSAFCRKPSSI